MDSGVKGLDKSPKPCRAPVLLDLLSTRSRRPGRRGKPKPRCGLVEEGDLGVDVEVDVAGGDELGCWFLKDNTRHVNDTRKGHLIGPCLIIQ